MSFIGIDNSTEYYSNHYLAAILEKDIQQVNLESQGTDPIRELRNLHQEYFDTQSKLRKQEKEEKYLIL